MPIYEFYCHRCHMVFDFFSRRINTTARPLCPRCKKIKLSRQLSTFAVVHAGEQNPQPDLADFDEGKMERAMTTLAAQAENVDENDPVAAAQLMRKFSKMTGLELGAGMQEALKRMEAGEDPEQIEQELGDVLEEEEPFLLSKKKAAAQKAPPRKDTTLYEL